MKDHYRPEPVPKHDPGKHASPWHKAIAEAGTILRTEVGSGVHGTAVSGYDDQDIMGVCIEPADAVIGNKQFEQYEWHTAWEREGGRRNRSGHGDVDTTIYSLRKWMRLAMHGNPSVLVLLFAPEEQVYYSTKLGRILRKEGPKFILSKQAGAKFIGYLRAQRHAMESHEGKGKDVTRPELIEKYGFDTKFAGHMVRLGYQGLELLRDGKLTLPMKEDERDTVRAIRTGHFTMRECLDLSEALERSIEEYMKGDNSPLPESPDYDVIDQWLVLAYKHHWVNTIPGYKGRY